MQANCSIDQGWSIHSPYYIVYDSSYACTTQWSGSVRIIEYKTTLPANKTSVIIDVAASPNDPLFIVHHPMIDCIFEEWLKMTSQCRVSHCYRCTSRSSTIWLYCSILSTLHAQWCAENFGYSCSLSDLQESFATTSMKIITWPAPLPKTNIALELGEWFWISITSEYVHWLAIVMSLDFFL